MRRAVETEVKSYYGKRQIYYVFAVFAFILPLWPFLM